MKYLKLIIILVTFIMLGCEKEDDSSNRHSIDSVILISAFETSPLGDIVLDCQTKKQYECYNYNILAANRTSQWSINISFIAIEKENLCATAFGPARTEINLGELPIGEYNLTFEIMGEQNNGLLIVTQTQIILEFDNLEGIEILTPTVERRT